MKTHKIELSQRLQEVEEQLIDLWRTMSSLWGISPTMGQIHGLLYITGAALSMDDIMVRLGISRGNVSMNLSKLVEWGLVRRVHHRGVPARLLRIAGRCLGNVYSSRRPTQASGSGSDLKYPTPLPWRVVSRSLGTRRRTTRRRANASSALMIYTRSYL